MSLIHTESFFAFGAVVSDDTFNTGNTTIRQAQAANLQRSGYDVNLPTNAAATTSGGLIVRADPVDATRNALVFSTASIAAGPVTGFRKAIPSSSDPIIFGFSLFIPVEFVKSSIASTGIAMRVAATGVGDTAWFNAPVATPATTKEVFRIRPDLLIGWVTDAAQSSKALVPGQLNYIECRISDSDVRVWIDDTLVMQKTVPLIPESIAVIFETIASVGGSTVLSGAAGRWAISNFYILTEDTHAPNVRLGPSTRVIGSRPDTDIDVRFTRPVGPVSNAAVVGQDLVDNPPFTLQSTVVGDYDIYATSTDTSTAGGALVHAVAVKVLAANLETAQHALRPIIRSGGIESVDPRTRGYELRSPVSVRAIRSMATRPSDGKVFACGASFSIYATPPNGDGTSWATLADDGSAGINRAIAIRADGTGVIARDDGKISVMAPGSDVWTLVAPTGGGGTVPLNAVVVLPNGTFVAVGNTGRAIRSSTPAVVGSWVASVINAANNYATIAASAAGRIIVGDNATTTAYSSDDSGATWAPRVTGLTNSAMTHDGTAFLSGQASVSGTGTILIRRSVDAAAWSPISTLANANTTATSNPFNFAVSNTANGQSIFIGSGGALQTSRDGLAFKTLTPLTGGNLRCGTLTANGDFLIAGDAGVLISYKPLPNDWPLTPLAGYQATFNSSAIDPATGVNWTPSAASSAQFGMRLTS